MKKEGVGPYASARAADEARSTGKIMQAPPVSGEKDERTALALAEEIRPALVSVTTLWGRGAGFFLQGNFILTTRHCIEPERDILPALQEQIAQNRELLVLEEEKLAKYHARLENMRKGHAQDRLKLLISERKKYLADFRVRQEQDEQRLVQQKQAQEQPDIQIMLADGSEQMATLVQVSPNYDLALLRLVSRQKSVVLAGPPSGSLLRLGDLIVLPGSSTDEKMTINFFAGYRRIGVRNQMYLQLNAVIPQHKSGGPVLDAAGCVRGVVTQTVGREEGAGFAVPIERVFEEFAAALQG